MQVAGLFAGIGGFELGMASAGHQTSLLCEIWAPARAVLVAHHPDAPLVADIVDLTDLPSETQAVVAGFPCQDLSQAGMTAGIDGRRSGLVGHVFRLLDQRRAPWVVLENVSFMLHLDSGRGLRALMDAFEQRGYRWAYRVVNSLAFLPQRRERVLFVATTTDVDPASVLLADDVYPPEPSTLLATHAHGFYWTEGIRGLGWARDAIPTLKNGSTIGIASPPAILLPSGRVVTPDIRDAERLQGFEAGWTEPAANVGRASHRWSLVGNAVTVPVAKWLGERLVEPGCYERDRDRELAAGARWPKAARFDGVRRRRVEIGAFPVWRARPPLADFLRYEGKNLSARATRGFLSRTERSSLRFPPGFLYRLHSHAAAMEPQIPGPRGGMKLEPPDPRRSALMARVRQRGTTPELVVASVLRKLGFAYRLNVRALAGSPDFANRKRQWAIYVQGCFWHHHTGCVRAAVPKANGAFWRDKFTTNRRRDAKAIRTLRLESFRVVVVWECETRQVARLTARLAKALGGL